MVSDGKIRSTFFVNFAKVFLVYVFLEYFLTSLSENEVYVYAIKFLGDFLLAIFIIYTLSKAKNKGLLPEQKFGLFLLFAALALVSTFQNRIEFINFVLGLRSLFRYYIIYFLSFYYDLTWQDFESVSNFFVKSFYIEFALFFVYYFVFGTTDVLNHSYLVQALYLNAVLSLVLYRNELNVKSFILVLLLAIQAFLSTSRLALIGLILQGAIYIFAIWKRKMFVKVSAAFGLATIILVLFISPLGGYITESEQYTKLSELELSPDSEENFRLYLFEHFTEISIENGNIVGDGPNTFGSLYTREYNPEYYYQYDFTDQTIPYAADSDYTNILMQYGFAGLIMFYILIFSMYRSSAAAFKPLLILYLGFIVFASFAIPVFSMRVSSFWLFMLFAFSHNISTEKIRNNATEKKQTELVERRKKNENTYR